MADDYLVLGDMQVPSTVFQGYVQQKTKELSKLLSSGIAINNPSLDILASSGGKQVTLPFFKDLTGNSVLWDETLDIEVNPITTSKDIARLLLREKSWGSTDLSSDLTGTDPMTVIGNSVAGFWARDEQTTMIQILAGVFADNLANDSGDLIHDISSASIASTTDSTRISGSAIIDGFALLGDASDSLTHIAMNHATFTFLNKQNLIATIQASVTQGVHQTYMGKIVVVDDAVPTRAGGTDGVIHSAFLYGAGAFGVGYGKVSHPIETDRDSTGGGGRDILITRVNKIIHPMGFAWQEASVAKDSPTNAELATASNWDRVVDKKQCKLARLDFNLENA